jgi:hypothetical protein
MNEILPIFPKKSDYVFFILYPQLDFQIKAEHISYTYSFTQLE